MDDVTKENLAPIIASLLGCFSSNDRTLMQSIIDARKVLEHLSLGITESHLGNKTSLILERFRIPANKIGDSNSACRFPLELKITLSQDKILKQSNARIERIQKRVSNIDLEWDEIKYNGKTVRPLILPRSLNINDHTKKRKSLCSVNQQINILTSSKPEKCATLISIRGCITPVLDMDVKLQSEMNKYKVRLYSYTKRYVSFEQKNGNEILQFIGFLAKKNSSVSSNILQSPVPIELYNLKAEIIKGIQGNYKNVNELKSIYANVHRASLVAVHITLLTQILDLEYNRNLTMRAEVDIREGKFHNWKTVNLQSVGNVKDLLFNQDKFMPNVSFKAFSTRCSFATGLLEFFSFFNLDIYDTSLPWEKISSIKGLVI
jgi:hypothetical protein